MARGEAALPRTPDTSLQRPTAARLNVGKGSPRSPLTSVRNIVAAWSSKEREDKVSCTPAIPSTKPSTGPAPAQPAARPFSIGDNPFSIRRRAAVSGDPPSELGVYPGGVHSSGAAEQGLRPSSSLTNRESMTPNLHPSEVGSQIRTDREVCYMLYHTLHLSSADRP